MVEPADRMSDIETLTWAIERNPRLRSPIVALVVLDGPVNKVDLRRRADRLSRVIPRLRRRVAADPYGIAPPSWETDPDFSLSFHLRFTDLNGTGTRADMHQLAAAMASEPFDRSRPLWEFLYVDGMADDSAALITKLHHSISDGVGSVQLAFELFDLAPEPDPARNDLPPAPEAPPEPLPTSERIRAAIEFEAANTSRQLRSVVESLGGSHHPLAAVERFGAALGGVARIIRTNKVDYEPLLADRSLNIEVDSILVPLEALRLAGHRIGGSVNDAFVAALLLGLRHYHAAHNRTDVTTARVAIPINRRSSETSDDVHNNWSPTRIDLPLDIPDPDELMARVRAEVRRLRDDPTNDLIPPIASVLRRLPAQVAASAYTTLVSGVDLTASNVPGAPFPIYLLGRRVVETVPFGPLAGAAINVTMLSTNGMVSIGITRDVAAVPDADQIVECFSQGLLEVIAG